MSNKNKTSIYNVTVSETTKNRKVVVCMMDYKKCSEKKALNFLSKKGAIIASNLSLNEASKVKSKINKFGYGAEINKIGETSDTTNIENKNKNEKIENLDPKFETKPDSDSTENIRILEKKLSNANNLNENRDKSKSTQNFDAQENKHSDNNEKKSSNFKFKLLVFIIAILLFFIIFLLLMIFAPSKKNLELIDNSKKEKSDEKVYVTDSESKRIKLLETKFMDQHKKMSLDLEELDKAEDNLNKYVSNSNKNKLNGVLKKSFDNKTKNSKRTDKTLKSDIQMTLLDPKSFFSEKYSDINNYNENIDELENLIDAIHDEEQRMLIREKIKELKRKILSKKRNVDEFMKKFKKINGDIKFAGNKFIGETNLPNDLKVTVKVIKPNKEVILKNKVVKDGRFSVKLNNSSSKVDKINSEIIDKGDYLVDVNIRSKTFQNDDIKEYVDQILKKNNNKTEFINKKFSLAEDILEKKLYYNISDVKKAMKKYILGTSNKKKIDVNEAPTITNESIYNIIIRDKIIKEGITEEDKIKSIIKSCAATGFTMNNYTNEGKNLKIYFNDSKFPDFSIPIEKCKNAMKEVNNNFNDAKFMDLILNGR